MRPTSYSTHIPFIPSESTLPFLRYSNFDILPWKSKVKVIGEFKIQCHNMGPTSSQFESCFFHVNPPSHSYDTDFFKISPWKSKVKVIAEGHTVGITPYRLISLSFDVHEPSHSYIQLFKNLSLKIQGHGHVWCELWKSQHRSNILSISHPFCSMSIGHPITKIWLFQNFTLKIQGQGHGEVNVESHNTGPTFHRLTSLSFHVNRMAWQWAETLVEIRGTLADIRGTTK